MKKFIGLVVTGFGVYFTWETWNKVEPLLENYQPGASTFPPLSVIIISGYVIAILAIYVFGLKLLFSKK